ncbi:MAG: class I adenylate-forming enzyme family protein [Thermodesulfobacteriota bacterium]|nr:class I adenylate-forming enzyme family protein [Thermodesulfobacteriota bacterium]
MFGQTLKDCFIDSCSVHGEKIAISFLREGVIETEITYQELDQDANRMANTFLDLGVEKGDRVILFLQKSVSFVVSHLALQKIGVIAVPFNPEFKKSEITYLLQNAEAKLVLSGSEQEASIKEVAPQLTNVVIQTERPYRDLDFFRSAPDSEPKVGIKPEDPGLIIYTSGTTGEPKGAVLTQKNLVHDTKNIIKIWEITESDVFCHSLPLFHVHGLNYALHTTLMAGAHVIMLDKFSPEKVVEVLSKRAGKYVCNMFMAVPSMYGKMMDYLGDKILDFEHMRLWTSGSAPLSVKDFEKIKVMFGKEPVEREGMSETGMNFSNSLKGARKPGSIGVPLPDLEARIVDPETFVDVAPGQTGEFWLKGPSITKGYWRKPEVTDNSFEKGWFKTGDLGRVDKDGYYYLTDRLKHIIISGGENVSPKEVEVVINQLGDVLDSSVVGIPDEKWGEKVVAAVVTRPGSKVESQDIQRFCREHIHKWKCPKEIVFLKELPKNTMGKVLKEEVKKFFLS